MSSSWETRRRGLSSLKGWPHGEQRQRFRSPRDHDPARTTHPSGLKDSPVAPLRRQAEQAGVGELRVRGGGRLRSLRPAASGLRGGMKRGADAGEACGEGPRKLGLCVLCGLPAAGKSTFARALSHQLRQERGWAVGVVAYDDIMPDAFLAEASARPLPSQWKLLRQELLKYIEYFLLAVINGCQMAAPPNRTEAMWEDFINCLKDQDLLCSAALEAQSCYLLTKTAVCRPLFLILDDNFYYQSMRYEVYQLARKYSLGFCQLFLDCSLETCLRRNDQRPRALPAETIHLMGRKIEEPNPEKNAWEHRSLTIRSPACSSEASPELTDLLLTALENPVKYAEDNVEQKETDRIICSTNILHQADQTLRRIISQTMKEAKEKHWMQLATHLWVTIQNMKNRGLEQQWQHD
ncbi:L-seryl-tRNA(Sec) kinase isoform X4 [Rhinolophus sinicus]|uniref:L-seryl-tRNA(Sec) kinase isoform X4 n=1 Tax=Rhinolophus sinicus TaxID=89399 RepID=UPI003D7BFAB5